MVKKINVMVAIILMIFTSFYVTACNKKDDLIWTNDNAVYAYVKEGFENDILKDIERAFKSLHFQKVYVTEKNTNQWTPLTLLFIIEENEISNKQEFVSLLQQDERINHVSMCRDFPFETVDTRYIEKKKDCIAIGESLRLTIKGTIDSYIQPFDFGGLFVKPKINKNYTIKDFREIDLKSVKEEGNGWLYLELKEKEYFNVIKASNMLSRSSSIEAITQDKNNISIIPSIWQVSDETIVSIEINSDNYGSIVITGQKSGKVTVDFAGVKCEIVVQ